MDATFCSLGPIKIFTCNANKTLAQDIAKILDEPLGNAEVSAFADGEIKMCINETVRNHDVFIIQPTSNPTNNNLMELLIMIDAMKRASAGRITAVIPYFGYARQDRKARSRDPISAKLVANLISTAGADRVLTIDLHCPQIQGFFDIPVDHLYGMPKFTRYYLEKFKNNNDSVTVVSPDFGNAPMARKLAQKLDVPVAVIEKRRQEANKSEVLNIIGDVFGRKVVLIDDMIDTAGSITNAVQAIKDAGATDIYVSCTHGIFSGPAIERIENSAIKELVTLDTIEIDRNKITDKFNVLTVADLLAEAIKHIHDGTSISELFE